MRIVYFGTPQISADILSILLERELNVVAVVTQPDRARGRKGSPTPSPVARVAKDQPVLKPVTCRDLNFQEELKSFDADLFVVFAFGQILPQALLDIPKVVSINVHPSLLPKYRGAAPMQHALLAGDRKTGVTIMEMVQKMDAGPLLLTREIPLSESMTLGDLEEVVVKVGSEALIEVIKNIHTIEREPQNESLVTFAPKIDKEACLIDWSRAPHEIVNQVRGLSPRPGAYTFVEVGGKRLRLKVLRAQIGEGEMSFHGVRFLEVQLEGKRAMQMDDLERGVGKIRLSGPI